MKRPIAITFALPVESSNFVSRLSGKTTVNPKGINAIRGRIGDNEVEIVHTGVGEAICQDRIENFLRAQNFDFLISSGFAGAVREDLQAGDLMLAENFSEPELLLTAKKILQTRAVHAGRLFTSATMIDSEAERVAIAEADGASAIDMETKSIANACSARGIALLSLRVISDSLRDPLPAPPDVLFDIERQRTPFLRLATYAVKKPAVLVHLLRFQRQVAKARETLSDAIVTLVSRL